MLLQWLRQRFARKPHPLDSVTPRVQKLFVLTRQQADRLHHPYVGTEHLLLALLELKEGTGYTALQKLGVNPEVLQQDLAIRTRPGREGKIPTSIPSTPRFKKVVDLAGNEARLLGQDHVGTGHILLGLLRHRKGVAAQALQPLNISLEQARAAVRLTLSPATAPEKPSALPPPAAPPA